MPGLFVQYRVINPVVTLKTTVFQVHPGDANCRMAPRKHIELRM